MTTDKDTELLMRRIDEEQRFNALSRLIFFWCQLFALVLTAVQIFTLGHEQTLARAAVFHIPGGVFTYGWGFVLVGMQLALGKLIGPRCLRISHGIAAGWYTFMCFVSVFAWVLPPHFVVGAIAYFPAMIWLHIRVAIDLPLLPLKARRD